jgi:hypothetical protein
MRRQAARLASQSSKYAVAPSNAVALSIFHLANPALLGAT